VRPGVRKATVYRLEGARPVRVDLLVGISDGQQTEVVSGLAEGDRVVLADESQGAPRGKRGPF
jgi:hypothetical protein